MENWESDIIKTTTETKTNQRQLWEALSDKKEKLYIVSDGSCKEEHGTFGWVIGTDTEILWTGAGRASGEPMSSHRAEAYGMLSWTCFLGRYLEYFNIEAKCEIESFCDNMDVIKQTKFDRHDSVKGTTIPDFDVINETKLLQGKLKAKAPKLRQSQHVKGHQDNKEEEHNLSRQAQLNIKADKIAKIEMDAAILQRAPSKFNPMPHCKAYLRSGNKTQTSGEMRTLRWKWSDIQLQEYYRRRLKLTDKELHEINWRGLKLAKERMSEAEKTFAIKFLTDWLPTGHQNKKYGALVTECHRCGKDETVDHLLQCEDNTDAKEEYIKGLERLLEELETNQEIKKAMISGIESWLNGSNPTKTNSKTESDECYNSQCDVGWNLLVRGLVVTDWGLAQERHAAPIQAGTVSDTWTASLCKWLVREGRSIWMQRNEENFSEPEGKTRDEQEAIEQITRLYSMEGELSQHDKAILGLPMEERLQQPVKSLQKWISSTYSVVQYCAKSFKEKMRTGQKDIRSFFKKKSNRARGNSSDEQIVEQDDRTANATRNKMNDSLGQSITSG